MIHVQVADDVVVECVEVQDAEEIHCLVLLHVDHFDRAVLDRGQEVTAGLDAQGGHDDLAGWPASVLAMPGRPQVETDHAGQIGMAWMIAAVLAATCSTLVPLLIGHHRDVGAFLGQGVAQALTGLDEVAGGKKRNGTDLAL